MVQTKSHLFVSIQNLIADIKFSQEFKNNHSSPVECVYEFPTDAEYAVARVRVTIDEKEIVTEIHEKEEAKQKYDDAIASGNTAVKVSYNEEVPDVLNLNIG